MMLHATHGRRILRSGLVSWIGMNAIAACSRLAVLAGNPEHVAGAPVVGKAGGDEEEIGQAVDVARRLRVDRLAGGERHGQALGAAGDGAAEMEGRGGAACRRAGRRR